MLGVLNHELVSFDQPDRFMGLLCARVDVRGGRLWIANAGITPPLVRRRNGRFEELTESGVLLGVSPGAAYPDIVVELGAGDVVVLHTDGLTEARRGDEMFGAGRVRDVLDANAGRRATDVLEALIRAVREFTDRPLDDLTIVVLRQLAAPVRDAAPPHFALKFGRQAAESLE
jgi:sigma-B regulation protein RsbU (phosphoserine phosphatase)